MTQTTPAKPLTRYEKLLREEVQACDDPICCCEAEPRWLRFNEPDDAPPGEWESLQRSTADEL